MSKPSKKYFDYSLLLVIIILIIFGLVMIYSASSYSAQMSGKAPGYYMIKQAEIAAAGLVCMIIVSLINYKWIIKFAFPAYLLSLVLIVITMFFGNEINGKKRWLQIGPLSFQPAEFAKIAVILLLAVLIANMGDEINTPRGVLKILIPDLIAAVLAGMTSLSSGIIIFAIAFIMLFVSTGHSYVYLIVLGAVILLLAFVEPISTFLYNIGFLQGYQYSRIMVWLEPEAHPLDGGYQVLQGLYAIGSGGLMGKGLGESIQKLGFVPEAQNDMIFSIICEELGLIGAIMRMMIFLFLIYRLLVLANSAPNKYGALICVGVMAHIAIQVILNIAVVCNVIPNTGITLPFVSAGGTSVFLLMIEMGIVLSVSRNIEVRDQ